MPPVVAPPLQPDAQAAPTEKAHQQALENAKAAAKNQLAPVLKEQPKSASAPPPAPDVKAATSKGSETKTGEAIASPISATKQQRLMQLLDAYRKDQLTPAQYHQERAKVLAEP